MKKLFLFAALAAAVLTSCVKTHDTHKSTSQGDALSFGVYTPRTVDTKATYGDIASTTTLQGSTDGFGVFAYYTMKYNWADASQDWDGSVAGDQKLGEATIPNFMYNQQVVYDAGANATLYPANWVYTPLKYWPNGQNASTGVEDYTAAATSADKISFFAYAPHIATADLNSVPAAGQGITSMSNNYDKGVPTITFSVPDNTNQQIDLLYATPVYDQTKMALNGKVSFTFHHALSKLNYQVQAVVDDTPANAPTSNLTNDGDDVLETDETMIILKSLVISAAGAKTGTLELATGTWTLPGSPVTSVITYDSDAFNFGKETGNAYDASTNSIAIEPVTGYSGFNVLEAAHDINSKIAPMIIPGTIAAHGLQVTADYYVITKDTALAAGYSVVENQITADNAAGITFAQGKKYNIVVRLGLNSVDFNVTSVDGWDSQTGDPIDLPANS